MQALVGYMLAYNLHVCTYTYISQGISQPLAIYQCLMSKYQASSQRHSKANLSRKPSDIHPSSPMLLPAGDSEVHQSVGRGSRIPSQRPQRKSVHYIMSNNSRRTSLELASPADGAEGSFEGLSGAEIDLQLELLRAASTLDSRTPSTVVSMPDTFQP